MEEQPQAPGPFRPGAFMVGIGTPAPQDWLDINGIGMFRRPNLWHRFWAWFLLGWRWQESLGVQGWLVAKRK